MEKIQRKKKKIENLLVETRHVGIRIGRKLLRSSTAITRKPPSGPFDVTRAPTKASPPQPRYRDKHPPERRGARRSGERGHAIPHPPSASPPFS